VQGALSESKTFLDTWTLVMGVLFVLVVLFLPSGLAGLMSQLLTKIWPPNGHHRNETIDVKSSRPEEVA
jgi:urea transport system permease protein